MLMKNLLKNSIKYYFDNDFESFRKVCLEAGFKEVYKNLSLTFLNQEFYLTHKAINYKEGVINLFGHSHRSCGLYKPFGFNIGCDLNHFRLYNEENIEFMLNMKKEYWDKDKKEWYIIFDYTHGEDGDFVSLIDNNQDMIYMNASEIEQHKFYSEKIEV